MTLVKLTLHSLCLPGGMSGQNVSTVVIILGVLCATLLVDSCADACSGRQIYNSTSGVITDGTGDYPMSTNCEWLITGNVSYHHVMNIFNLRSRI